MSLRFGITACLSRVLGAVVAALCSTSVCLAAAAVCSQLESQLSSMGTNSGGGYQQYSDAAKRQRNELAMAQGAAQQAGCFGGFLFFMPQPSPRCGALMANVDRMQANLSRLEQARDQNSRYSTTAASRMRVLQALGDAQCGPQYAPYASGRGYYGGPSQLNPPSARGNYRTLCVRTCDGYYFPISDRTNSGHFATDQAVCQSLCPGADVGLYVHQNPGQQSEDMVSLNGTAYTSQPFAFLYRQSYNPACTCNPASNGVAGGAGFTKVPRVAVAGAVSVPGAVGDQTGDTGPIVPAPMPRPDRLADPETLANMKGGFTPVPITPKVSEAIAAAAQSGPRVRVVGPSYSYLSAPATPTLATPQAAAGDSIPSTAIEAKGP